MRDVIPGAPAAQSPSPAPLDREAQRWVDSTFKKLTLDQMVGQVLMPRFASVYTSTDSEIYDQLAELIRDAHIGGVIGFGGEEPVPPVLLNDTYGNIVLGQPFDLASMLNRFQAVSPLPLLTAADFEWGVGMRIAGATKFPRAMAFGAAGDERSRSRPAASRRSKAARSVCTSILLRSPTSTTTRAIR